MKRNLLITLACLLSLLLPACNQDEFVTTSYKTIEASAQIYNTVFDAAYDARAAGKLSNEQWWKVEKASIVFHDTYQAACSSLAVYAGILNIQDTDLEEVPTKERVTELISSLTYAAQDIAELWATVKGGSGSGK